MRRQHTGYEVAVYAVAVIRADPGQSEGFSLLEEVGKALVAEHGATGQHIGMAVFALADALKEGFERCGRCCGVGGGGACHNDLRKLNKTNAHGNAFRSMTTRTTNGQGGIKSKGYAVATDRPQRLGRVAVAFFSIVQGDRASTTKKLCQTAAEATHYWKATPFSGLPRARDGTKTNAANGNRCGVVS